MGLTKKQKAERAAVAAGTHQAATDEFGNPYFERVREAPETPMVCVHCGGKAVLIIGQQLTPGNMPPYKHAPGVGKNCPKAWGPLEETDVRAA